MHSFDAKFIMQLSHSGRQMDLPGVHNQARRAPSSTSRTEPLHGFLCQAMSKAEIDHTIAAFARGAWRAREAGLDGVELHSANGYLFSQFMSSGINDRKDEYGGSLENRARFLLNVIEAIRNAVGRDFHLQVKLSAIDHNNVMPLEKPGNTLEDTVTIAKWAEAAGADAIHVSQGSLFPHPLNPPGDLSLETLTTTYDAMISSGVHGMRNYLLFRYPLLRPIFHWLWFRMKKGKPIEGVNLEEARVIRKAVKIPVLCTGGFQTASFIRNAINSGAVDGVTIARSLVANNDLVQQWAAGADRPEKPCTYCNRCLVSAMKNPMGCYDVSRYPSREAMIDAVMTVYRVHGQFVIPSKEVMSR